MSEENWTFDIQDNLDREFAETPAMVSYYGNRYAEMRRVRDRLKLIRDQVRGAAYLEVRDLLEQAGSKRPTVAEIEAHVAKHPKVREAEDGVITGEYEYFVARSNLNAVIAKKDMLQSLGAYVREEMRQLRLSKDDSPNYVTHIDESEFTERR